MWQSARNLDDWNPGMKWTLRTDPSGFQTRWSDEMADRYLSEGHWTNTTLVDAARKSLAADPDHLLLIEGENRMTRQQCWDQALRLAGFFLSRGLKPGDVISFQLPNWTETGVIALAARMTGLVINPIPPIYRESELAYILADCRAKLIFVPGLFRKHDHAAMMAGLKRIAARNARYCGGSRYGRSHLGRGARPCPRQTRRRCPRSIPRR